MARASAAAENAATNGVTAVSPYLSLHTADPGTTGASEVSGGSYARQSEAWGNSANGVASNTGTLSVPVPASTTVAYAGHWSAATSGTYSIGGALSSSVSTGSSAASVVFSPGSDQISTT